MSEKWFDDTPKVNCFTCIYGFHMPGRPYVQTKCCNKKSPFHGKICKECTESHCSHWVWCWSDKGQQVYRKHIATRKFKTCYCGMEYEVKGAAGR